MKLGRWQNNLNNFRINACDEKNKKRSFDPGENERKIYKNQILSLLNIYYFSERCMKKNQTNPTWCFKNLQNYENVVIHLEIGKEEEKSCNLKILFYTNSAGKLE